MIVSFVTVGQGLWTIAASYKASPPKTQTHFMTLLLPWKRTHCGSTKLCHICADLCFTKMRPKLTSVKYLNVLYLSECAMWRRMWRFMCYLFITWLWPKKSRCVILRSCYVKQRNVAQIYIDIYVFKLDNLGQKCFLFSHSWYLVIHNNKEYFQFQKEKFVLIWT